MLHRHAGTVNAVKLITYASVVIAIAADATITIAVALCTAIPSQ